MDHRLVSLIVFFTLVCYHSKEEYKHTPKRIGVKNEHSFSEVVLIFPDRLV